MEDLAGATIEDVVESLCDGVYICDPERRITYWSKSAERITGWISADVEGRRCCDNILCHIDKDGHALCGKEFCPLHRAMISGHSSKAPLLVYARKADGRRIPTLVSVSPIHDSAGKLLGGVESFRDASAVVHDMERAVAIQRIALEDGLPEDAPIRITTHYAPCEIVGGDYYGIKRLGEGQYGILLADVMGHGIAAALYTMHLSSLWERYHRLMKRPAEFAATVNHALAGVVKEDESFATAVCGLIDVNERVFRFAGAGCPPVLLMHADGTNECHDSPGFPLAIMQEAEYEEVSVEFQESDRLLLFSDGAIEVRNVAGEMLGVEGLVRILQGYGYPKCDIPMQTLEEDLWKYSHTIRLDDDLTILEVRGARD